MSQGWRSIGKGRQVIFDVLWLAKKVPSFPVEATFDLGELADLRKQASPRISWLTVMARAYSLAAVEHPLLRSSFFRWPYPRLYESRYTVISCSVNRKVNGEDRLFFGRLRWPESKSLREVQDELLRYQQEPVEQIFKEQVAAQAVPTFLRRIGWWWRMRVNASQRTRRIGSASISTLANYGVRNRLHPCIFTSSLDYSPLSEDGQMSLTIQCDHRVLDGVAAAEALLSIGQHLRETLVDELRELVSEEVKQDAA